MTHELLERICSDWPRIYWSIMRAILSHTRQDRVLFTPGELMGTSNRLLFARISVVVDVTTAYLWF